MRLLSVFIGALLVTLGCSESPEVARCVPGQTVVCPCIGGGSGVQTCTQDEVYGVCQGCQSEDMGEEEDQPLDTSTPDTPTDSLVGTACTPVGSATGAPSPGVCEDGIALNCIDGTYQPQDCGSDVCRQVPIVVGESEYPFAICTELEGDICNLRDEPFCDNEKVKWCEPFTIQNWPYTTEFYEIYGAFMEGTCQSDEVCDRGICVLQGGNCDEYEATCEGDGAYVQCYPGEPKIRYQCFEGSVCRSSLACDFGASCVLEELLQEEPCAEDAPAAECLGPDLIRICPGTDCWGETECTCLPRYQNCSEGYVCQNGACVADVDCTQGTRCDGEVLIECDGTPSLFDCSLEGLSCVELNGVAGCGQPNAQSCNGFDLACEGNSVTGCCQENGFFIGRSVIPCVPGYELSVACTRPDSPPYACSNGTCEFRF